MCIAFQSEVEKKGKKSLQATNEISNDKTNKSQTDGFLSFCKQSGHHPYSAFVVWNVSDTRINRSHPKAKWCEQILYSLAKWESSDALGTRSRRAAFALAKYATFPFVDHFLSPEV